MRVRFVGKHSIVGDMEFSSFGQFTDMTKGQFIDTIRGGAAFIPEKAFEALDFSQEDLQRYCGEYYFGEVPEHVSLKIEAARELFRQLLAQVRETGDFVEEVA